MFKKLISLLSVFLISACVPMNKPLQNSIVYSDEDRIDSLTIQYAGYCYIREIKIYKQSFYLWGLLKQEPIDLVFKATPSGKSSAKIHYDKDYNIDVLKLFNTYYKYYKTVDIKNNEVYFIDYKIENLEFMNRKIEKNNRVFELEYETEYSSFYKQARISKLNIVNKDTDNGFYYHKVTKELDLSCFSAEGLDSFSYRIKTERKKDADSLLEDFIAIDIDAKSTYGVFIPNVGVIPIGEY